MVHDNTTSLFQHGKCVYFGGDGGTIVAYINKCRKVITHGIVSSIVFWLQYLQLFHDSIIYNTSSHSLLNVTVIQLIFAER